MITILAPLSAEVEDFEVIMKTSATRRTSSMWIYWGHTEVTDAVSRFVLVGTCIREEDRKAGYIKGAKPGDVVVITGSAGTEGTR